MAKVHLSPEAQGVPRCGSRSNPHLEFIQDRLIPLFEGAWSRLHLRMEVHDLALSKLEKGRDRDRDDVSASRRQAI